MKNITKVSQTGFILNGIERQFQPFWVDENTEHAVVRLNDEAAHIGTHRGIIRLDISFTIDNIKYNTIDEFIINLYA